MRVSVSHLDKVAYARNHEFWSTTPEAIAEEIRTRKPSTQAMRRGTAFHKVLEDFDYLKQLDSPPIADATEEVEGETFKFRFLLKDEFSLPRIRELKGWKDHDILGVPVRLVGMCDAIHGRKVYDHKLTKKIDFDQYEDGMQWRAYCSIFAADEVVFNLFQQYTGSDGITKVNRLEQLNMFRYPELENDVVKSLEEHVRFCQKWAPDLINEELGNEPF